MKTIIRTTYAGKIGDLQDRDELQLITNSQDVEEVKDYFGNRPSVRRFEGFLVDVGDGEYGDVYKFESNIAHNSYPVWRITRTYSESKPKAKTAKKAKSKSKGGSSMTSLRGIRG